MNMQKFTKVPQAPRSVKNHLYAEILNTSIPLRENRVSPANIISRREIEPLLLKAHETLKSYEKATNSVVAVLDQTGRDVGDSHCNKILSFCSLCRKSCRRNNGEWEDDIYPCTQMHIDGITSARNSRGSYIYMCELGFMFWVSPIVANGCFAGALIAGGYLGIEREKSAEKISRMSGGEISRENAAVLLENISEKRHEDIKALAQSLMFCAEWVSRSTENYPETVKRISEQESNLSHQLRLIKDRHTPKDDSKGYPLDKERILLAALRRGDGETSRKILNELLEILLASNPDSFQFMRLRAIELVVLLSRSAVPQNAAEDSIMLENNNRFIKRIQETRNIQDLTDLLHVIVERMSGQIFSFQGFRHASALKKAERFIWENYGRKISLQEISRASGLSAPYFSSIFKEEMGENLSSYLNRLRVDKAATLLTESDLSLNEIARLCGFEDQSWFSKIFKRYIGVSPGKYRDQGSSIGLTSPVGVFQPVDRQE
jgi:AraC-like DNA-binding protein/ligand-binding sensor protein